MNIEITSQRDNPLLKRREVYFRIEHASEGSTPRRSEVRKAVADSLKANLDLVFVKKYETKAGMNVAFGLANVYKTIDEARLIEPKFILSRNNPPQETKEKSKE